MSRKNVEIIEGMLGRVQHDPRALWDILDDDVCWEAGMTPDAGATHRGPAGVREFFRRWVGTFDAWGFEVLEVVDAGESVAVRIRQWGRGKGSGAAVDQDFWQVWTLRDGRVIRGTNHPQRAEALASAGLTGPAGPGGGGSV